MIVDKKIISAFNFLNEHWVLLTTAIVLLSALTGYLFTEFYYSEFGVDFLHFSELSDLVLLPIINRHFTLAIGLAVILACLIIRGGYLLVVRSEYYAAKKKEVGIVRFIIGGLAFVIYTPIFAILSVGVFFYPFQEINAKINKTKSGLSGYYSVVYSKNENHLSCVNLVGSTTANLIFWQSEKQETIIIPRSQVIKIVVMVAAPPEINPSKIDPAKVKEYERWANKIKKKCIHIKVLGQVSGS